MGLRTKTMAVSLVLGFFGTSVVFAHPKGVVHSGGHLKPQQVKVSVTKAVLFLTRKTEKTCATQAVFPAIDKSVDLSLNKTVRVALPAQPRTSLLNWRPQRDSNPDSDAGPLDTSGPKVGESDNSTGEEGTDHDQ